MIPLRPALISLLTSLLATALLIMTAAHVQGVFWRPSPVPSYERSFPERNEPLELSPPVVERGPRPVVVAWERWRAGPTFMLYDDGSWIRELEQSYLTAGSLDQGEYYALLAAFRGLDLLSVHPRLWLEPVALHTHAYTVCVGHGERWHCGAVSGMAPRGSDVACSWGTLGTRDQQPVPAPMERARALIRGIDEWGARRWQPEEYAILYWLARVEPSQTAAWQALLRPVPWPAWLPPLRKVKDHDDVGWQRITLEQAARLHAFQRAHPEATSFDDGQGLYVVDSLWPELPGADTIRAVEAAFFAVARAAENPGDADFD